jgi:tetratricopeptide (TPR) repeat protein
MFSRCPRCFAFFIVFLAIHTGTFCQVTLTAPATLPLDEIARYKPDSAYILLKEQLLLFQAKGYTEGEALCHQKMGQVLFRMGSYPQAVKHLLEADRIYRTTDKPEMLAENFNMLGTVYHYNRQPVEALSQFKQALSVYENKKNPSGLSETYALIGQWHEKNFKPDSALFFQRLALGYALKSKNQSALAKIYENMGSVYEDLPDYDSARFYYQQSLDLYRSLDLKQEQVEVVNNLGDIYSKTGDHINGLKYARVAMSLALEEQDKYQLQSAYRDLGESFQAIGKYDSAYLYLEKSRELVQEIYTGDNQKQIALMQTMYEFEQKNSEIAQLNAGRKVYDTIMITVVLVSVLLGLLALAVNSRQKLKILNEKRLNEQNQRIYHTEKDLMESELRMKQMEEVNLKQQLETRSRELSSHILHLIQKNEVMEEIRSGLHEIIKDDRRDQKKQLRQLLNKINFSFAQDDYWSEFRLIFDKVHASFFTDLKHHCPDLTPAEIRLLALVKMDLNSADMAKLLGVTQDSLRVMRYRVKKKMCLDPNDSLQQFIQQLG